MSNTSNYKRDSSDACNIYTRCNFTYPAYDGPYTFGTSVGITYAPEIYDQEFEFIVFGANYLGYTYDTPSNIAAYTGSQLILDKPTITGFTLTIDNNLGIVTTSANVSNIQGLLTYYLTYSNIYTTNVITVYPDTSNIPGDFSFGYSTANFLELFSNIVTIYASNTSNSSWTSAGSNIGGTTAGVSLAQPYLNPIAFTDNGNDTYKLTTMTPTYINNNYNIQPYIKTIWTLGCNSTGTGTFTDITPSITVMNTYFDNTNFVYSNSIPDINYFVGAQFQISNAYNVFYGLRSNINGINNQNTTSISGTLNTNVASITTPTQIINGITANIISINYTFYNPGDDTYLDIRRITNQGRRVIVVLLTGISGDQTTTGIYTFPNNIFRIYLEFGGISDDAQYIDYIINYSI